MAKQSKTSLLIGLGIGAAGLGFLWSKRAKASTMTTTKQLPILPDTPTPDYKIGKYFSLREFLVSEKFPKIKNYRPNLEEIKNLTTLVARILDPLREKFGKVIITSGGRPEIVAQAYGSTWYEGLKEAGFNPAQKSDHPNFSAADFVPVEVKGVAKWQELVKWIRDNPDVRQALFYIKKGKDGIGAIAHVHVSVVTGSKPRFVEETKRIIFSVDGKYMPTPKEFA